MGSLGETHVEGFLADRAASALAPSLSYWSGFMKAQEGGLWTPETPEGYVSMVIAENRLSSDLVQAGLDKYAVGWPASMLHYQDARGIIELRSSVARMLQRTIAQGVCIDPDHLTVLAGAGSIIDLLLHCVANPGDAVLIPAPYYPAFDNDLKVRNQVVPFPAHLDWSQQDLNAGLEAAAAAVRQQGRRVAAVLFTNPTNPQGLVLSRPQVRSIISWCLKNKVHCISDEVYALSVLNPSAKFVSALQVVEQDRGELGEGHNLTGDLVHAVFGASKAFCGSGLRMGVLHSRNSSLNTALGNLGYFCSPPAPLQWTLAQLLGDEGWLDGFLSENRRRMLAAYNTLTGALDAVGIPYTPAPAGMFLWVDARAAFGGSSNSGSNGSENGSNGSGSNGGSNGSNISGSSGSSSGSWQDEAELWQHMVDVHRLVLTPGSACHASEPGFFRMCWAWPHPGSIPIAAQRLAAAIQQFRQARQDVQQQQQPVDQQQKAQQQQQQQVAGTGLKGSPGAAAAAPATAAAVVEDVVK